MDSTAYIRKWIDEVCDKFKDIQVKYAFEQGTRFHIIHVLPETYQNNDEYASMVMDFEDKFIELYPMEDIVVSEPSIYDDMSEVRYEKRWGKMMSNVPFPIQVGCPIPNMFVSETLFNEKMRLTCDVLKPVYLKSPILTTSNNSQYNLAA